MKTKLLRRLCLYIGLASSLAITSLNAQVSLNFVRFQSETIAKTEYDYINIDALVINTGTGVRVGIFNNTTPTGSASATKPTVASIFFDASSSYLNTTPTFNTGMSSSGVEFVFGGSPGDLPGGTQIGFSADSNFTATPPPPKNGLNPGEFAYFDFAGSSYDKVVKGLYNGNVRFGVHVLQVGPKGEDSLSLVTTAIPEPSSALLGLLGAALFMTRRKR
ncbi:MAG: hypothetical protein RLZZ505_1232 [Verrucomicrobiota bacterium]|jgi:hypothetical protein